MKRHVKSSTAADVGGAPDAPPCLAPDPEGPGLATAYDMTAVFQESCISCIPFVREFPLPGINFNVVNIVSRVSPVDIVVYTKTRPKTASIRKK